MYSLTGFSQSLKLYTEDYRPFQYYDGEGEVAGFSVDLVRMMFDRAGVNIEGDEISIYPWSRAYREARKNKDSAVFLTTRDERRENLFKWVGPLAPREMWLYKLKERTDIHLASLEDAKQYRVGGVKNGADTNYMLQLGLNVTTGASQGSLLLPFVIKGQIDLVASLDITMVSRLNALGLDNGMVEKAVLLDDRYDYYMAINKETSDDTVRKLQLALDRIKANGDYDRLWQKYIQHESP